MVKKARVQYEKRSLSSACEAMLEIGNIGMTTTTLKLSHQIWCIEDACTDIFEEAWHHS